MDFTKIKKFLIEIFIGVVSSYVAFMLLENINLNEILYKNIILLLVILLAVLSFKNYSLKKDSNTDLKTGARTCKCFNETFKRNIFFRRKFSIFYIDLDKFKDVNDQYGHDTGDEYLKVFTKSIIEVLPGNCEFFRLGGDEFIVTAIDTVSISDILELVDTINSNVYKKEIFANKHKLQISFSIGIASFPKDGKTIEEIKKSADMAMYQAKSNISNNINCNYHVYNQKRIIDLESIVL